MNAPHALKDARPTVGHLLEQLQRARSKPQRKPEPAPPADPAKLWWGMIAATSACVALAAMLLFS